ncbi:MAG: hypothetical protein DMG22_15595 [Acidobacteria bacterium]|nr:MAG: hypothetical protein DMG22_15595 [Acidobacteriota bacterium]
MSSGTDAIDALTLASAGCRYAVHSTIWFVVFGVCLWGACSGASTVWKADVRSPDGSWIASASTTQIGGPGTDAIDTVVYLKPTKYSNPPQEILAFSSEGPVPRPYVLDNKANAGGTIDLSMKWIAPSHLEVTYDGRRGRLNFQVVKYLEIDISVRDISSEPTH